jgi:hypothetical protein
MILASQRWFCRYCSVASDGARSTEIIEALIGQPFPTTIVAHLVTPRINDRTEATAEKSFLQRHCWKDKPLVLKCRHISESVTWIGRAPKVVLSDTTI